MQEGGRRGNAATRQGRPWVCCLLCMSSKPPSAQLASRLCRALALAGPPPDRAAPARLLLEGRPPAAQRAAAGAAGAAAVHAEGSPAPACLPAYRACWGLGSCLADAVDTPAASSPPTLSRIHRPHHHRLQGQRPAKQELELPANLPVGCLRRKVAEWLARPPQLLRLLGGVSARRCPALRLACRNQRALRPAPWFASPAQPSLPVAAASTPCTLVGPLLYISLCRAASWAATGAAWPPAARASSWSCARSARRATTTAAQTPKQRHPAPPPPGAC